MRFAFVRYCMMAASLNVIAACAKDPVKPPEPPPTRIVVDITAGADINPDIAGRPSPVTLRIYELKSLSVFNTADFYSLYGQDTATLGDELLAREVLELRPGEQRQFERDVKVESHFLGVIAAYRDQENARWRTSVEIPAHQTTKLVISVDKLDVTFVKANSE
jgi:type VI secretion system protein VasD